MDYEQVFQEAVSIWRAQQSAEPAIVFVREQLASGASGELRGRLLYLLGMFQKRSGAFVDALVSHRGATESLSAGPHCLDVWVSMIDIHVNLRQVEDGYRAVFQAERLLESVDESTRLRVSPVLLNNTGRLAMVHNDFVSAAEKFSRAMEVAKDDITGGHMTMAVSLAEALFGLGRVEEAKALCNDVRGRDVPNYVLVEVNVLLGRIAAKQADAVTAERFLDKARTVMAAHIGKRDVSLLLAIIKAESELDEVRGDSVGANRLRTLVEQWTGAVHNVN